MDTTYWIMSSESALLISGDIASLGTRLESESSLDISQDSKFGWKEEIWTPKIRTKPPLRTARAWKRPSRVRELEGNEVTVELPI